jgi:polar amino acid transport system substrate-binding protein
MIKKNSGLGAYYSEYFIQYHYAAFSLKSNQFNIKKISDLKNYYCISSQNATKYLGKEFSIIAKESGKKYSEVANQKEQVYKLLRGRTNVIIMDKYIFKFYQNELISEGKINKGIEVEVSELFKPTKYRIAFKDKSIRDDFNKGIEKLKNSGRYDKIYESYINKYFELRI